MDTRKYRMIAIDLDGTLLSPTGTVTARTRDAVHRALGAGLLVCFATGRNWTESQTILDAIAHYDTAVFVGGAMVVDTKRRLTLHRTMMRPELAAEVCQVLETLGHAVLALQDTHSAGVDYLMTSDAPANPSTLQWMRNTQATFRHHPRLGEHSHEHTIRVGICAASDEVRRVKQTLIKRFGEQILCQNLFVPTYGVEVLEVFDPGVNKWEGVLHVARAHGIAAGEIVAIGDDLNDVPMLRNAGLGVAMGNARPEARAAARHVIGANSEEGLAVFLEELVAQHVVEPLDEDGVKGCETST
jgi:Cof subfamily protein (haloacid dehalogenase superfamily)